MGPAVVPVFGPGDSDVSKSCDDAAGIADQRPLRRTRGDEDVAPRRTRQLTIFRHLREEEAGLFCGLDGSAAVGEETGT